MACVKGGKKPVSDTQLAKAVLDAGFATRSTLSKLVTRLDDQPAVMAVAVALAEHGGNVMEDCENETEDRGSFQINRRWHPEVSDSCAFNLQCSAKAVYRITSTGLFWSAWVTYKEGTHKQYLDRAREAVEKAGDGIVADSPIEAVTGKENPLEGPVDALQGLLGIFEFLTKGENWLRVALFAGALVAFGLAFWSFTGGGIPTPMGVARKIVKG